MIHDVLLKNQHLHDINPLICGYEACREGHGFGPASREYYLIHYIVSGKGTYRTARGLQRLSKGDLFIIHPDEITYYEADRDNPWAYIWVGFQLAPELVSRFDFLREDAMYGICCETIFHSMLQSGDCVEREIYLCSKLFELFSVLQGRVTVQKDQETFRVYAEEAQDYMAANYMKPISVQSISDALGLDRRYFSSIFHKKAGCSPKQYLINLRLEKAARLLAEGNYSPAEAARSTGYDDIFNFSKMFKKKYGLAPLHYQRKYRVPR